MLRLYFLAIICTSVRGLVENTHLCDGLSALNCANSYTPGEINEVVCGSDGATYQNFCYYSQARCKTPTTHIAYVGPCSVTTLVFTAQAQTTSTPTHGQTTNMPVQAQTTDSKTTVVTDTATATGTPTQGTTIPDVLTQVFCASKDSVNCTTDLQPVCGSDGQFYLNRCDFSKNQCDDKTLTLKGIDFCLSGSGQ